MALKITLKPYEKLIIGGAVITNGQHKCELVVENKVPVLRQDNIISPEKANSPALRIYLTIQLMYVDRQNLAAHQKLYWQLVKEFLEAAPSALELLDRINEWIYNEEYYRALQLTQQLVDFEKEVIERVTKCDEGLPVD
jgi:flagellar biosynthesis repressor protein FlbT